MRKEKLEELNQLIEKYKTIKVTNEKQINEGFLKIIQADYTINNGKTINRERYLKNNNDPHSCIILTETEDGEIILAVQPRVQCERTVGIECPAGLIEKDEEPLVAAKRELLEETGYEPEEMIPLIEQCYQDISTSRGKTNMYLARNCKKVQEQHLDETEYIGLFKCTFEEALELIDLKYINDIVTILIFEKAKKYFQKAK